MLIRYPMGMINIIKKFEKSKGDFMEDIKLDLFACKSDELIIPSEADAEKTKADTHLGDGLISEGLERAIRGGTVKTLMIPEDFEVALPNYVIDLTKVEELYEFQMDALDALLHPDGDTTIYAYTLTGMVKLGRGLSDILDRILAISLTNLFHSTCTLYKDFVPGEKLHKVSEKDIRTMRLSI
jgi:hypothetical protein